MTQSVFCMVLLCVLLLDGSLILSIVDRERRVWPPPHRFSWQYWFTWSLFTLAVCGVAALGILDRGSFPLGSRMRLLVGALPMMLGAAFGLWGVVALGAHASQGLGGDLVTAGPYRYSRNPQYVGNVAFVLGFGFLCASVLALSAAFGLALWFVLAPFAEEPWLRARLGSSYKSYLDSAPRFVSLCRRRGGRAA